MDSKRNDEICAKVREIAGSVAELYAWLWDNKTHALRYRAIETANGDDYALRCLDRIQDDLTCIKIQYEG